MKKPVLLLFSFLLCSSLHAQIVNVPDANFKAALVNNPAINTNGDGEIQVAEAEAYDGAIMVSGLDIADLTGIEAFTGIDSLDCSENLLTNLDVSSNVALAYLDCSGPYFPPHITTLDVSSNAALVYLNCSDHDLTTLDVSANPALEYLNCGYNELTSLDLSANPALRYLGCYDNHFASLDVSTNLALIGLNCSYNELTSLDLRGNPALEILFCGGNYFLNDLDVSPNPVLKILECGENQLTSLDVSSNPALAVLWCYENQLISLDVSSNAALLDLDCSYNNISNLVLSANPALEKLNCSSNQLTSLDVSAAPALKGLWCDENQLTGLDVSANLALEWLMCYENHLTSLDVSYNAALLGLDCSSNQLTSLNIQNGNNVAMCYYGSCHFEAHDNPNLSCIQVDDPAWASSHWSYSIDPTATFSTDCTNSIATIGNSSVSVYPNPTTGSLAIDLGATYQDVVVEMKGAQGQSVFRKRFPSADLLDMEIDGPAGMYFMRVWISREKAATFKILKF